MGQSSSQPKNGSSSIKNRPQNLYAEARDMAASSFLMYTFGYLLETARRHPNEFKGLPVSKRQQQPKLPRNLTPKRVAQLIMDNQKLLQADFPRAFGKRQQQALWQSLQLLQQRSKSSNKRHPLVLKVYNDTHQKHEPVYAIAVDHSQRRLTVAFRGTDSLAIVGNWTTNLQVTPVRAKGLSSSVKGQLPSSKIQFHRGFYRYLFAKLKPRGNRQTNPPHETKFDEIVSQLRKLLQSNPNYQIYVTGHSLGGALAAIFSFHLACDTTKTFTKPNARPIVCLSFGAPRVGDIHFVRSVRQFEQVGKLQYLRVVNHQDSVTTVPPLPYHHAGVEIKLYKQPHKAPQISHASLSDSSQNIADKLQSLVWGSTKLLQSVNLQYDHGDYRERIDAHQSTLQRYTVSSLYGGGTRRRSLK